MIIVLYYYVRCKYDDGGKYKVQALSSPSMSPSTTVRVMNLGQNIQIKKYTKDKITNMHIGHGYDIRVLIITVQHHQWWNYGVRGATWRISLESCFNHCSKIYQKL